MYFNLAKAAMAFIFRKPNLILDRLKKHFRKSPAKYPIVRATFPRYRHPCIAVAIQAYLKSNCRRSAFVGTATYDQDLTLSDLIHPDRSMQQFEGSGQYREVTLDHGRTMSYAKQGLYLVNDNGQKLAIFINEGGRNDEEVSVEVIARERAVAQRMVATIRKLADANSIYRAKVLSFHVKQWEPPAIKFHSVPIVQRNQIILPANILDQIEKHTTRFSRHHKLLLARGQHLKRGLLLYGPPGTGKTLSMMHVISSMPGRTTILMNGASIEHLEDACALARSLQPATVVIDDVDLVVEERSRNSNNKVLFELLNQMDGIAVDCDVLFLLGTNKPEVLEPALAARPGRIDQAIMIPLPDEECRLRLFEFYGKHIPLVLTDPQKLAEETIGASGAFIRELFRKAVLLAADEGPEVAIEDRHLEDALTALRSGGSMLEKLLAFEAKVDAAVA